MSVGEMPSRPLGANHGITGAPCERSAVTDDDEPPRDERQGRLAVPRRRFVTHRDRAGRRASEFYSTREGGAREEQ